MERREAEGRNDNLLGIPICFVMVRVVGGPHLYVKLGLRCHPVVGNKLMIEDRCPDLGFSSLA